MAKLKMQKIELIALTTDSKKIIEMLQRKGVVEVSEFTNKDLIKVNVDSIIAEFDKFRSLADDALKIINSFDSEKKSLAGALSDNKIEMSKHDFGQKTDLLETALHYAADVQKNNRIITESITALGQLEIKRDSLKQWLNLDTQMNFKGTSSTSVFIGTIPKKLTSEEIADIFPEECFAEIIFADKTHTNIFIICLKSIENQVNDILSKNSFTPIYFDESLTPQQLQNNLIKESELLNQKILQCRKNIISLSQKRDMIKFIIDYLQMRIDKYRALNHIAFTESAFVLYGYIPEKYALKTAEEIDSKYTAAVRIFDPDEDDEVPVLLENSKFSSPVENITEMYALPGKNDVDPTPVMSFFYYLFFGMMLSDAGYGLVMLISTALMLKKLDLSSRMRKTLTMFRNCGISTIIFGALFGSWFGDIIQIIGKEFFGKNIGSLALWFEPLNDPIKLLLYSFLLGIIHLFSGIAVSFKMQWDDGKKIDAFLDTVPIYLIITGICPFAAGILITVPGYLKTFGMYVSVVGVIILILTAGRSSKSIFGKLFGGLYALYKTATDYLSDILSYSRLLALGLATGSIASVINLIGTMPNNIILKSFLLAAVFIVGHTANLAINLLGAYVHTGRLQFVELFSKFYEGGGRAFEPLTVKTNYIKFKEEFINE